MLSYFPQIYRDELLYSVLARYHLHTCSISAKQTLDDLFGRRSVRAAPGLQGYLGALASRIPPDRGLSPQRLARECTLFPYYAAFQPHPVVKVVLASLIDGTVDAVNARFGIAASAVPAPFTLRYCPTCHEEALTRWGERYWRRAHQLAGALVCPDHGDPLVDTAVQPGKTHQHEFIAATDEVCDSVGATSPWITDERCREMLLMIARRSADLLVSIPKGETFSDWTDTYRRSLMERNLASSDRRVYQRRLLDAFCNVFAPVAEALPVVAEQGWLADISRKHRHAFHPLHHILFRLFLYHYSGEPGLARRHARPSTGHRPPSSNGEAKYQKSEVRQRWLSLQRQEPSLGRKALASRLPAVHIWLYRHDSAWLASHSPPRVIRTGPAARKDWSAIDQKIAARVQNTATHLALLEPPVRVTQSELERRIGCPGWINKRRRKLPLTMRTVAAVAETVERFQIRRISWARRMLAKSGRPPQTWKVRRLAGISGHAGPAVERALALSRFNDSDLPCQ